MYYVHGQHQRAVLFVCSGPVFYNKKRFGDSSFRIFKKQNLRNITLLFFFKGNTISVVQFMHGEFNPNKYESVYINFSGNISSSRNKIGQEIFTLEYVCVKVHYLFQNAKLPWYL